MTKKTRSSPAEKTRAFATGFPQHPLQAAFVDAATKLRAADIAKGEAGNGPGQRKSKSDALAQARAEFKDAVEAIIFPPPDDRFYVIWFKTPDAEFLATYFSEAWHEKPGVYGDLPPQHWIAKSATDGS